MCQKKVSSPNLPPSTKKCDIQCWVEICIEKSNWLIKLMEEWIYNRDNFVFQGHFNRRNLRTVFTYNNRTTYKTTRCSLHYGYTSTHLESLRNSLVTDCLTDSSNIWIYEQRLRAGTWMSNTSKMKKWTLTVTKVDYCFLLLADEFRCATNMFVWQAFANCLGCD